MHVAHHQFYWKKKNQNDADGVTWTRHEYIHYVTDKLADQQTIDFFSTVSARQEPNRPGLPAKVRHPTIAQEDRPRRGKMNVWTKFAKQLLSAFRRACGRPRKKRLEKHPKRKRPLASRPQKASHRIYCDANKRNMAEEIRYPSSSSASASKPAENTAKERQQQPVKVSASRQRNFLKMQKPQKRCILNSNKNSPRSNGSSALRASFVTRILIHVFLMMPCFGVTLAGLLSASIAVVMARHVTILLLITLPSSENNSCPTVLVLRILLLTLTKSLIMCWNTLHFSAPQEVSKTALEKKQLKISLKPLRRGNKVGNNYFQNFVQYGVEDFPFTDFVYIPGSSRRVPTVEEHSLTTFGHKIRRPCRSGALRFSWIAHMMI